MDNTETKKIYLEDAPGYFKGVIAAFLFALAVNIFSYGILKGEGLGINVPLSVLAFYIARGISMPEWSFTRGGNWVLLIFMAAFSMSFVFFNNGFLLFLNVVSIMAVSGIQLALASGCCDSKSDKSVFFAAVHNIFAKPFMGIVAFIRGIFKKREASPKRKLAIGIVVGILAALAVTIPVIVLLASADAMFSRLVEKVFALDSFGELVGRIAVFIAVLIFAGSIFTSALTKRMPRDRASAKRPRFNLIAVYIVLGMLTIPLIAFAAVQLRYMTGAALLPVGVTYAEYARTGFFQLCIAAIIVFAVIAVSVAFTRHAEKKAKIGLNVLYTLLTLGTLMLLVSSFLRMSLYESVFGYTRLRLYVQAFMILLGIVTVFVALRVWIEKLPILRIVFVCTLAGLVGLTYFNADGFIGRHNAYEAVPVDAETSESEDFVDYGEAGLDYLTTLSIDAFPGYAHTLKIEDFTEIEIDYDKYDYDPDRPAEEQYALDHELDLLHQHNYNVSQRRSALEDMYEKVTADKTFSFNTTRSSLLPVLEDLYERGFFETEEDRLEEYDETVVLEEY